MLETSCPAFSSGTMSERSYHGLGLDVMRVCIYIYIYIYTVLNFYLFPVLGERYSCARNKSSSLLQRYHERTLLPWFRVSRNASVCIYLSTHHGPVAELLVEADGLDVASPLQVIHDEDLLELRAPRQELHQVALLHLRQGQLQQLVQ